MASPPAIARLPSNASASDPPQRSPEPPKSAISSKSGPTSIGGTGSQKKTVVTVPPWARHEQPVPDEDLFLSPGSAYGNGGLHPMPSTSSHDWMASDIASFTSSAGADRPHSGNWWTFTVPRLIKPVVSEAAEDGSSSPTVSDDVERGVRRRRISKPRPNMKQKNRSSWIGYALSSVNATKRKEKQSTEGTVTGDPASESSGTDHDEEADHIPNADEEEAEHDDTFDGDGPSTFTPRFRRTTPRRGSSNLLHLDIPLSPAPFTKAQNETPGWDSPWNPRKYFPEPEPAHSSRDRAGSVGTGRLDLNRRDSTVSRRSYNRTGTMSSKKPQNTWKRRRRKFRNWCLHNLYVPLLFRVLNLAFTSATLGVAVGIRRLEKNSNALGILGSSSTVTIIFGPFTLMHVLVAIYLEYFGRPVGLWQTSAKLAYTLLEVVLICAWAASLALCFNDYFTTPLQCGPQSTNRWWSNLPPTKNPLADQTQEGQTGEHLCDYQAALICMAYLTLTSYCSNLVISLFRIIEKVKNYSTRSRVYWQ